MTGEVQLSDEGIKAVRARHPWVYRDHVFAGGAAPGDVVRVLDKRRRQIGIAAWSASSKIALRFLAFGAVDPPTTDQLRERFRLAVARREGLRQHTDAVRLISSEADGFPGLIVDQYRNAAVIQALNAFADRLLPDLVVWLAELGVEVVVARHDSALRDKEGLARGITVLAGDPHPDPVEVHEDGLFFRVDLVEGQKTGLFLDQRDNRMRFGRLVPPGARVLDAFTYAGGFAMQAARNGGEVLAFDDSERAVAATLGNAARNQLPNLRCERANAFQLLRDLAKQRQRFAAIVLDPPAFARNRAEVANALRGYREINRHAFRMVEDGGLLVTASCSYQLQEPMFEDMLRRAAGDAGRTATIVYRGSQDVDHPALLSLPQSRYLKCYFLRVEGSGEEGPLDDASEGR